MNPGKILFVDDDPNLLDGYRRTLRKDFDAEFALGPEKGLEAIDSGIEFAIVVADMRMPGMDGIEFLKRVKELSPASVRMMLTGNADVATAIDAVNHGSVFKFMTKPCPAEQLRDILIQGIGEYRRLTVEREAAFVDGLSGLHNRKCLERKLDDENALRKRYDSEKQNDYSILFIDLDNFKHYNDTFGHPVGDLVLKEFSEILKSLMREADFPARYGGDEFFVLLPDTGVDGAVAIAKRIKEELRERKYFKLSIEKLLGHEITLTDDKRLSCSIGIASAVPGTGEDLRQLLKRADDSVLEAKRHGKDCFIVWKAKD